MLDLLDELRSLVSVLDEQKIEYALRGGMAMGVHGLARTTIDIDFLIDSESLAKVLTIAQSLGYNIRGKEMGFAKGEVEIRRISKIDPADGELLSLDLLLVTPAVQEAWDSRMQTEWEGGKLSVVSTDGLIALKRLRNSEQDLLDIKALAGDDYEEEN
jgi:hypothetical protein